jgi:hypothetical protein
MKFDAENQHAEAFKCRGFDGYNNLDGDTVTKAGDLVKKGTEFAQSEKGQAAIQAGKDLLAFKRKISARRNPDEEVATKCGKKPLLGKKKKNAWDKCREETLAARAAAAAAGNESTPPDNSGSTPPDNSVDNSIVTGGTPNNTEKSAKSAKSTTDAEPPFDWKKNWWVLPLGLGVLYLGYTKFIKKN